MAGCSSGRRGRIRCEARSLGWLIASRDPPGSPPPRRRSAHRRPPLHGCAGTASGRLPLDAPFLHRSERSKQSVPGAGVGRFRHPHRSLWGQRRTVLFRGGGPDGRPGEDFAHTPRHRGARAFPCEFRRIPASPSSAHPVHRENAPERLPAPVPRHREAVAGPVTRQRQTHLTPDISRTVGLTSTASASAAAIATAATIPNSVGSDTASYSEATRPPT